MELDKVDVVFSCGHHEIVTLPQNQYSRKSKLKWIQTKGLCRACYAKQYQRNTEEDCLSINKRVNDGTIPKLSGTEKQISWAEYLRISAYHILKNMGQLYCFEYIKDEDTADWWIAHRDGLEDFAIVRSDYAVTMCQCQFLADYGTNRITKGIAKAWLVGNPKSIACFLTSSREKKIIYNRFREQYEKSTLSKDDIYFLDLDEDSESAIVSYSDLYRLATILNTTVFELIKDDVVSIIKNVDWLILYDHTSAYNDENLPRRFLHLLPQKYKDPQN